MKPDASAWNGPQALRNGAANAMQALVVGAQFGRARPMLQPVDAGLAAGVLDDALALKASPSDMQTIFASSPPGANGSRGRECVGNSIRRLAAFDKSCAICREAAAGSATRARRSPPRSPAARLSPRSISWPRPGDPAWQPPRSINGTQTHGS